MYLPRYRAHKYPALYPDPWYFCRLFTSTARFSAKKAPRLPPLTRPLTKLAADMIDTMHEAHGIGLGRPANRPSHPALRRRPARDRRPISTGSLRRRAPADRPVHTAHDRESQVLKIVPEPTDSYEEGLPFFPRDPRRCGPPRRDHGEVSGRRRRAAHPARCNGLLARCVQHEADHLNGVLFIDRMTKPVLATIEPELKALKKQTREAAKKS